MPLPVFCMHWISTSERSSRRIPISTARLVTPRAKSSVPFCSTYWTYNIRIIIHCTRRGAPIGATSISRIRRIFTNTWAAGRQAIRPESETQAGGLCREKDPREEESSHHERAFHDKFSRSQKEARLHRPAWDRTATDFLRERLTIEEIPISLPWQTHSENLKRRHVGHLFVVPENEVKGRRWRATCV